LDPSQHLAVAAYGHCDQFGFRNYSGGFRDHTLTDPVGHVDIDQHEIGALAASLIERTRQGPRGSGEFDLRILAEQVDKCVFQFGVVRDHNDPEPALSTRK
jgi:hypothetical protein